MRSDTDQTLAIAGSKLTDQLVEIFVRLVMAGNYYNAACKAVGISGVTFRRWMDLGCAATSPDDKYRQFYLKVLEADAYAETYAVQSWRKQFGRDYRASRDFLARRYPERWGMQQKITLAVESELKTILQVLESRLPADIYGQVIVALSDARDRAQEASEFNDDGIGDPFLSFDTLEGVEEEL